METTLKEILTKLQSIAQNPTDARINELKEINNSILVIKATAHKDQIYCFEGNTKFKKLQSKIERCKDMSEYIRDCQFEWNESQEIHQLIV